MIQFPCSACGTIFTVPDDAAGRTGKCHKCGAQNTVPNDASSPIAQSATTTAPTPPAIQTQFCRNCGKPVAMQAVACMACGLAPTNGNKFCRICGATTHPEAVVCIKSLSEYYTHDHWHVKCGLRMRLSSTCMEGAQCQLVARQSFTRFPMPSGNGSIWLSRFTRPVVKVGVRDCRCGTS